MSNGKNKGSSTSKPDHNYRSAETGQYVTRRYAERHPHTTVKERK